MSRNGSGTYSVVNTFVAGATITAAGHNQNWADMAAEMTNSVAADGQTTMTGPLKAAPGTAAAPSITFGADPDSGLYRIDSNNLGISIAGSKVGDWTTTGLAITGTLTSSGAHTVTAGGLTVTAGGATITAGGLTVTAGGATVTAGGITLVDGVYTAPVGAVGTPSYTFAGDTDSGLYRIGANNIGVAVNGAKVLDVSTSGLAITGALTATTITATNVAAQSDQETGTSTTTFVSPGRQQYHASAAKAWAQFNAAVSVSASYNVSSVTDVGTGSWTPNLTTAFSSASFSVQATVGMSSSLAIGSNSSNGRTTTAVPLVAFNSSNALADTTGFADFLAFGDQ